MRLIDLTGQTFGRLTVIERVAAPVERRPGVYWRCACVCGRERTANGKDLRSGDVLLCGTTCVHTAGRRPWPHDPRYRVGTDGTIIGPRGDVLKPQLNDGGYRAVMVVTGGRRWWRPVHAMVCETYHGPRPDGMEVAHLNGVRTDCRAENLAWKTRSDNHADKILHGTAQRGEAANNRKLTEAAVRAIRRAASEGCSCPSIAAEYGMSRGQIYRIVQRQAWAHI